VKEIVFLGGGRITSALVAGLHLSKFNKPIVVHDRNFHKLRQLRKLYRVSIERDLRRAVDRANILIVAVRPASVSQVLSKIGGVDRPLIAVSLAAGIPLAKLRAMLGPPVKWVRAMPSPVSRVGHGLTAVTFDRSFPANRRREVQGFFEAVGEVVQIPEKKFDAFTVTYSSSHGYHALATLARAAVALGLDEKRARSAAAHALADGIVAWREGNTSLTELLNEAATPGGIAATVMEKMNQAGYQKAIRAGLEAGLRRAQRNAKL
jgi:pyrroline-5-carboxylate reductase